MLGKYVKYLILFVVAAAVPPACTGGVGDAPDAAPPGSDAAPAADAGGPFVTDDIDGQWTVVIGEGQGPLPMYTCQAAIADGGFDLTCSGSYRVQPIGDNCDLVTAAVRLYGTLDAALLAGAVDRITRYQGANCTSFGFTTGVDVTDAAVATLAAARRPQRPPGGFWGAVNGLWRWTGRDAGADDGVDCDVDLDGGAWSLDCVLGPATEVLPYCTMTPHATGQGTLGATHLAGRLTFERRYQGSCAPAYPEPRVVEGVLDLAADRM